MDKVEIPAFTKEDFMHSTAPFEFVMGYQDNRFKQEQVLSMMKDYARTLKIMNFATLFKQYVKSMNEQNGIADENYTEFEGFDTQLKCGEWTCNDFGITTIDKFGYRVTACSHPIVPVERYVNVDTNIEKLKIAYKKGASWRYITVDKECLASTNKILSLANYGVAVNSESAKFLVKYLTDIETLNYNEIPEFNSVERLGWIKTHGFSPYVENLVFDGDQSYKALFETIRAEGDFDEWKDLCKKIRKEGDDSARIMLAASFASPLIEPCNALPFFVHLWGGSENGKSVSLVLAASVWGNPLIGEYIRTFNATDVSQELTAAFYNSMPYCMDELQIKKDVRDFDGMIYKLAEGAGKSRGRKSGGVQKVPKWRNCILSTGEFPLLNERTGGGAVNRVIQIDCANRKVFENPRDIFVILSRNYGFAGKMFVEWLQEPENMERVLKKQDEIYEELRSTESTEKQALSASLILTADYFATEIIFKDGANLKAEDIIPYLMTHKEINQNARCLNFIYDFVSINSNHFNVNSFGDYTGEVWGTDSDNMIYIIKTKFDAFLQNEGYNSTAFLAWAKTKGIITIDPRGKTCVSRKINGKCVRCVALKRVEAEELELEQEEVELLP